MPNTVRRFAPVAVLGTGCVLLLRIGDQSNTELLGGLDRIPVAIAGHSGRDQVVNEEEQRVAGMDTYLLRTYQQDSTSAFSLYIGYYKAQTQGKTIHSPKNCLPGAGWEPVENGPLTVALPTGTMTVNRYVLEKGSSKAVVYYWYQGRDRVSWNEYAVKWELLRDKAMHGRSEEALVRIVVPLRGRNAAVADSIASAAAREIVPALFSLLQPLASSRES